MKRWVLPLVLVTLVSAQQAAPDSEDRELNLALADAGGSRIDFVHALEHHLAKYPDSAKKPEIERALVKAAIELKDDKRIVLYGERVLDREPGDPQILDHVVRALLSNDDPASAARALAYARRYEEQLSSLRREPPVSLFTKADWATELDRSIARALALEARATGNLGKSGEALALAQKSYEEFPTAESAREIAKWLVKLSRSQEAIPRLADAFTIADPRATDSARAQDRLRMGELYQKLHGSEKGLGDLILESYDRTTALIAERKLRARASDPNSQAASLMDFTLPGVNAGSLKLASLKGKTIIFDFWATWCGPCRAQHALYEQVQQRFAGNAGVTFVSVNTDEDRESVPLFLKENRWTNLVYFEDGLAHLLRITSIPTTIIVDRAGEVASRMNGYVPERFVDLLTERIQQTMKD